MARASQLNRKHQHQVSKKARVVKRKKVVKSKRKKLIWMICSVMTMMTAQPKLLLKRSRLIKRRRRQRNQ